VPESADLRASDQDRERVATEIREHFAAGRLDDDELNERVEAAYAARTMGDLNALRADLPALPVTRKQARTELSARRADLRRQMLQQSGGALAPFAICAAIWALAGASGPFWPAWLLIFPLIALLKTSWALYGPAPDLDRVERRLQRREHHHHRNGGHRRARHRNHRL
jgi:hypothetical protein